MRQATAYAPLAQNACSHLRLTFLAPALLPCPAARYRAASSAATSPSSGTPKRTFARDERPNFRGDRTSRSTPERSQRWDRTSTAGPLSAYPKKRDMQYESIGKSRPEWKNERYLRVRGKLDDAEPQDRHAVQRTAAYRLSRELKEVDLKRKMGEYSDSGALQRAGQLFALSPKDAWNHKTFTQLIDLALKAGRPKVAFELFNDMKKRGMIPDPLTYAFFFEALAQDRARHDHAAFERVLGLFGELEALRARVWPANEGGAGEDGSEKVELQKLRSRANVFQGAYNTYMKMLGRARRLDEAFDVLSRMALPHDPIRPDCLSFTTIFSGLGAQAERTSEADVQRAKDLWRQWGTLLDKAPAEEVDDLRPDAKALEVMIALFRKAARPEDRTFPLPLLRDHVGLQTSGDQAQAGDPSGDSDSSKGGSRMSTVRIELTSSLLAETLKLCLQIHRPRLVVEYLSQVLSARERFPKFRLERIHVDLLLAAHAALGDSAAALKLVDSEMEVEGVLPDDKGLEPRMNSFQIAMQACQAAGDVERALVVFDRWASYNAREGRNANEARKAKWGTEPRTRNPKKQWAPPRYEPESSYQNATPLARMLSDYLSLCACDTTTARRALDAIHAQLPLDTYPLFVDGLTGPTLTTKGPVSGHATITQADSARILHHARSRSHALFSAFEDVCACALDTGRSGAKVAPRESVELWKGVREKARAKVAKLEQAGVPPRRRERGKDGEGVVGAAGGGGGTGSGLGVGFGLNIADQEEWKEAEEEMAREEADGGLRREDGSAGLIKEWSKRQERKYHLWKKTSGKSGPRSKG